MLASERGVLVTSGPAFYVKGNDTSGVLSGLFTDEGVGPVGASVRG